MALNCSGLSTDTELNAYVFHIYVHSSASLRVWCLRLLMILNLILISRDYAENVTRYFSILRVQKIYRYVSNYFMQTSKYTLVMTTPRLKTLFSLEGYIWAPIYVSTRAWLMGDIANNMSWFLRVALWAIMWLIYYCITVHLSQCQWSNHESRDSEIAASFVIYPLKLRRDSSATNYLRLGDAYKKFQWIKSSVIGPIPNALGPIKIMALGSQVPMRK